MTDVQPDQVPIDPEPLPPEAATPVPLVDLTPLADPVDSPPATLKAHWLPSLVQVLGLLAIIGASLFVGGWCLRQSHDDFVNYARDNALSKKARIWVAANMVIGAGSAGLAFLFCLWLRRRQGFDAGLALARQLAYRLSPLALTITLPFIFSTKIWRDRDLHFMVFATAVGLISLGLWRLSLQAGPVIGGSLRLTLGKIVAPLRNILLHRHAPLYFVLFAASAYAAYFSYYTINAHNNLQTASFDLGIENNLMWNLIHGGPLFKTTPHESGPLSSHLGFHQTYLSFVLAPLYAIWAQPQTLLVIQAIFIGFGALPLFLLARRRLPPWVAVSLAIAYLFYAPVHGANLYDFHYPPFMPFFIWFLVYFVDRGATWTSLLFALLSISIREDVAGCVGLIGAYLVITGKRPRLGVVIATMGLVHFVTVKMIVMPLVLGGKSAYIHQYRDLVPQGIGGFGGVLLTVLGNVGYTAFTLVDEPRKLLYILQIMSPLVFLPWRRPIGILLSLPGFFFTLLATHYDPMIQISFQYTFFWTTFLFIAVVDNLEWIAAPRFLGDTKGQVRIASWTLAILTATLATSYQHGGILQTDTTIGGFGHVRFGPNKHDRERRAELYSLIAKIPSNAKVVSSETIVPHVSSRENAYTLRVGIFDADYILFESPIRGNEREDVQKALSSGKYGILARTKNFVLAQKGHATLENIDAIRNM